MNRTKNKLTTRLVIGILVLLTGLLIVKFTDNAITFLGFIMIFVGFIFTIGYAKTLIEFHFQLRTEKLENNFTRTIFSKLTTDLDDQLIRQIVPVDIPENFHVATINKGFVCVHDESSISSIQKGKQFLNTIQKKDVQVYLYIIDKLSISNNSQQEKFGFVSQGKFETFYVENGVALDNPWNISID